MNTRNRACSSVFGVVNLRNRKGKSRYEHGGCRRRALLLRTSTKEILNFLLPKILRPVCTQVPAGGKARADGRGNEPCDPAPRRAALADLDFPKKDYPVLATDCSPLRRSGPRWRLLTCELDPYTQHHARRLPRIICGPQEPRDQAAIYLARTFWSDHPQNKCLRETATSFSVLETPPRSTMPWTSSQTLAQAEFPTTSSEH